MNREEMERGKCKEEQMGEDIRIFVNIRQRGTTWHAMSVLDARVARLGSRIDPLTRFRDPNG
jgi:hypothetical protein